MKKLLLLCVAFFNGSSFAQRYEAESFTRQSGVQTESCREGGRNIGYINKGDWMEYNITVPKTGLYEIRTRTAGPAGAMVIKNANGTILARIAFNATTSGQVYTTSAGQISLPAGRQTIRIQAETDRWNFNWFEIAEKSLIQNTSFESSSEIISWTKEIARPGSMILAEDVVRKGNYSVRFELKKSDSPFVRSEIRLPSDTEAERWYGFSTYLQDWATDPIPEAIAQWHEVPDWHLGESWRSPPISLCIKNGRYYVMVLWCAKPVNSNLTKDGEKMYDLGPVDRDEWVDWVFHIRFDYGAGGILQVWKNDTLVMQRFGANSYNDKYYPYFKIGIYKWGWNGWQRYSPESSRVMYVDEVKVGGVGSTYKEVRP